MCNRHKANNSKKKHGFYSILLQVQIFIIIEQKTVKSSSTNENVLLLLFMCEWQLDFYFQ